MATNFFERQDDARRRTVLLLVCFALGMLTLVVLVYALCVFLFNFLNEEPGGVLRLWDPGLLATVGVGVTAVVGGGSFLKVAQLSAGGKAVALMLNGQEIQGNTADAQQRRLLNVVEEMAIASGVAMPVVYLLPEEAGINAFAAGHGPGDAVIGVSQGCLTYLTRDELQGVVGHEFSHILNGDMRLNLRVVGLIFGIIALSQIGFVLMRSVPRQRSSNERDGGGNLFLLGLGLYLLGMGGAFFGWLMQAAVSRQREFLADASSVQFTRNPDGIAGALKKIGGLRQGSRVAAPQANEVSHMFFGDAFMGQRLSDLLATHPPLVERIRRLDAQFDGTFPDVKPVGISAVEAQAPAPRRRLPIPNIVHGLPRGQALALAGVDATVDQVGRAEPRHVTYAHDLQTDLPERLVDAAKSPFSARALIYCLLLDARPEVRERQLGQLKASAEPRDFEETLRLAGPVGELSDAARLPLVDLTLPALRQMSPAQHQVFRAQVQALIHADNTVSLFEYTLHCVLKRYLDMDFNRVRPTVRYTRRSEVAAPLAVVLSGVAWEGADNEAAAEAAFAAGMRLYAGGTGPASGLLPPTRCHAQAFDDALQALALAAPAIKRQVVAACVACVQADQQVTVREGELLRAVCATLDCPLPPLVPDVISKARPEET
jgi:Zn-dependent protease with chaperone function